MDGPLGIRKAAADAGSTFALYRQLRDGGMIVLPGSVYHWVSTGIVPFPRVAEVARITGIPARDLNPALAQVAA